jgi:DNA-binding MarR family transcriptional regulator
MTHSAALTGPTLTGQDIGQAEHATRAVLDRLLARTGTQFHGWVIINLLAGGGGALGEDELTGRITHGLKIGEDSVHAAAAELAWQGLIRREPAAGRETRVALTPAGTARFEQIQGGIGQVTQRLYGGLPESDLAIAHRVLTTVTERANAELADAQLASA